MIVRTTCCVRRTKIIGECAWHWQKDGAIWDVDGTLVDTAELHFDAWKIACEELGAPFTRG